MKVDRTAFLTLTSLVATGAAIASTVAGCTLTSVTNNPDGGGTNVGTDGSVSDASANDRDSASLSDGGGDAGETCLAADVASTSDAGSGVGPTCEGITGPCAGDDGVDACVSALYDGSPAVFAEVKSRLEAKTDTCTFQEATAIVEGVVGLACTNATLEAKCAAAAEGMTCSGHTISMAQIDLCKRVIVASNQAARDRFENCASCPFTEGAGECFPLFAPTVE